MSADQRVLDRLDRIIGLLERMAHPESQFQSMIVDELPPTEDNLVQILSKQGINIDLLEFSHDEELAH